MNTPPPTPRDPLQPSPLLSAYFSDMPERQRFVRRIFDDTAPDYDRIERVLAFGSGPWYRREALRRAGLTPEQVRAFFRAVTQAYAQIHESEEKE